MKKVLFYSVFLLLAACSSDDVPEVPDSPSEPEDSTSVLQNIPADEFKEAFAHGGWWEDGVYDVFADGTTSGNLLTEVTGYSSTVITVVDESHVRQYHRSDADLQYLSVDTVSYAYDESNGSLAFSGGKLSFSQDKTFTVKSIDDNELRCEGPASFGNASAVKSVYVFKRMSNEDLERLKNIWTDENEIYVPLMSEDIDGSMFLQLFEKAGWAETGVYNLYEDGTIGTQNQLYLVDGFTSSQFHVDEAGRLTEYLHFDSTPSLYETNEGTFGYSKKELRFMNVRHDDLKKIFRLLSIDEKEMRCVGWPWMKYNETGVVRSVYVFERVSEDVVAHWREVWGK